MALSAKELFHRNRDDVKTAFAIIQSEAFERLIVMSKAAMSESSPTEEHMRGANKFVEYLMAMPDYEATDPEPITSGINHDFEIPERTLAKKKDKK